MYFPFITKRSDTYDQRLYRRKGGGGGGKSGGSGGKSSGSGGKSSGSGSKSSGSSGGIKPGRSSTPITTAGTSTSATTYGAGGGRALAIPSGQLFAGRLAGGGTRDQVYGDRVYGSGYPGIVGRGTAGRGFPFIFWPLAWGGVGYGGSSAYLHTTEYGRFDNTSRPGGIMMTAAFTSSSQNTTFRIVADNTTVSSLILNIVANCSSDITSPSTITSSTFNDSLASPKPEQTVQYYRASTVSLTLDGYNNTGVLEADGTPDTPLPTNIDTKLLSCLNATIGEAVPLIGSAGLQWTVPPSIGLISFAWVLWCLTSMF
ncbi:hypothetical protein BYT27DRAFT_7163500 [Phlegmacium glaucopus]|nr:hypothetical protein BYT27DRAFT_7163500 [Phlegmacium glaucopus]